MKKVSIKYITDSGISFEVFNNNQVSIFTSDGEKEFVFQKSNPKMIKKVAKILLEIAEPDFKFESNFKGY